MPQSFIRSLWPSLNSSNYEITSEPTTNYNCVAWAQGINYRTVDLSLDENEEPLLYPDLTCLTYIEYYEKEGFELCDSPEWEENYEKIAIYERHGETFEHVSRQLKEGVWTSKLGDWEDVEHTLEALQSEDYYGFPTWFMKKRII